MHIVLHVFNKDIIFKENKNGISVLILQLKYDHTSAYFNTVFFTYVGQIFNFTLTEFLVFFFANVRSYGIHLVSSSSSSSPPRKLIFKR
jgi:hypothetical protein